MYAKIARLYPATPCALRAMYGGRQKTKNGCPKKTAVVRHVCRQVYATQTPYALFTAYSLTDSKQPTFWNTGVFTFCPRQPAAHTLPVLY